MDTEVIAGSAVSEGVGLAPCAEDADVFLVSTCAFIPSARYEAEEWIRKALSWKRKRPKTRKLIVSGCLTQWDKPGAYAEKYPGVDLWAGIDQIKDIPHLVSKIFDGGITGKIVKSDAPSFIYGSGTPRLQLTPGHYAYIKISDGCDNRCTYCSIPGIRGRMRCRSIASITEEAEQLLKGGCKELILVGQDTTAFDGGTVPLLKALDPLDGDFWLRLMYAHPAHFTDELVECYAGARHLLPYVDLPLQHISDRILSLMGRRTKADGIKKLLSRMRSGIPGLALRTTFITGFPGETDEEFSELRSFVQEQRFERLGVFTFCPEPGTPAEKLPGRIPPALAEERKNSLMELQSRISQEHNRALLDKTVLAIIDETLGGKSVGRTYMDAPEIDNTVEVRGGKLKPGNIINCKVIAAEPYTLKAVVDERKDR